MSAECDAGFNPFPTIGTLVQQSTNQFVRWLCYDAEGNVNINLRNGSLTSSGPSTGLTVIASGQSIIPNSTLGSFVTFQLEESAAGITQQDLVLWSYDGSNDLNSIFGWESAFFTVTPTNRDVIVWIAQNRGSGSISLSSIIVNWKVVR
jgi:hypothetical protein